METIRSIKKIINIGTDELSESDLSLSYSSPFVGKVEADLLIYSYENGGYEGSGVAVWRHKGKWAYDYLGHCSCNGPTENMRQADNMKLTLAELRTILTSKDNAWSAHYVKVADYLTKYKN
jgi:hypothetical protein